MTDTRYVYGARCTWHGPISAVGKKVIQNQPPGAEPSGPPMTIPCCPHCEGILFEYPNKATWDNGVTQFDAKHPGYVEFVEWLGVTGGCWPNHVAAADVYKEITGKEVNLGT